MRTSLQLQFDLEELELRRTDFNVKAFRPYLQQVGRKLQREARRLVAKPAVSIEGQYPGKRTGALQKSVKYRLFKSGYGMKISQEMPKGSDDFYPAFLRYGTHNPKKPKWSIEPRKNYIEDVCEKNRAFSVDTVNRGLSDSLKGIFEK